MRLMICAGGTGGGVFPALAVANAFRTRPAGDPAQSPLLWVGSHGGMEADLVHRAGLEFAAIHGGGVHGVGGWRFLKNVGHLARGAWEAWELLARFRPHAVFVTGGYVTVPVAVAAWLQRVPIVMYVPDIEPGLALQFIARLARTITVTVADSQAYFRGRPVVVTGYPTRPELGALTRPQALSQLGLDPERRTVLVTGGSRGARSLNQAVFAALAEWLEVYQVVHLTGQLDWNAAEQAQAALPARLQAHYHPRPFLHEMGAALAAADLVVSRAGASVLGEYPLFGLPAVLVPYPYAWRYQKVNAAYLVTRGAAVQVVDEALGTQLKPTVQALLNDPERLQQMRQAARVAAVPEAAQRVADELFAVMD